MSSGDGDGWVVTSSGRRYWGRYGAAGLLLVSDGTGRDSAPVGPRPHVLLQLRACWTHHGGTWGMPGGAVDSHEHVVQGALREAYEETGLDPSSVQVLGSRVTATHGPWSYTVVLGRRDPAAADQHPSATTAESDDVRWVPLDDVASLPLHPGMGASWPSLHAWVREAGLVPAPDPAGPAGPAR